MSDPVNNDSMPVLVIVADGPEPRERLRGGDRRVRCWSKGEPSADTFAGDPERSGTYAWLEAARSVSLVIDVDARERAGRIAAAARAIRPDAAVLMLCHDCADEPGDGTLARAGRLRDVLRLDLDEELERLEAERRVWLLRTFAQGADTLPILVHADPDPDALASAFAVRALLPASAESMPIVSRGAMRRPENRRMAELLGIRVTEVGLAELRRLERLIAVDTQPAGLGGPDGPRLAVIDHHPARSDYHAEVLDVRPEYGATATMLTEYLRAAHERGLGAATATALLWGIRTDTDELRRGVTPADVAAYAFLQEHADPALLRQLQRPAYTQEAARTLGRGMERVRIVRDVAVCHLGALDAEWAHLLPEAADFCLDIEGVSWSVGSAVIGDCVEAALRHSEYRGPGVDALAHRLIRAGGTGGGHAAMARVRLPWSGFGGRTDDEVRDELATRIADAVESLRRGRRGRDEASPARATPRE